MLTVLDNDKSVSYTQAVFSLREQGKEKVHEDISDQGRRDLAIFSCRNVFSFTALFP